MNQSKKPTHLRRPYAKQVPEWMRVVAWDSLSQPVRGAMSDEWVCGPSLACEAYDLASPFPSERNKDFTGTREEQPNASMAAFGYLFRRFGPPQSGGDNYKRMCEYLLGTPLPDLMLCIAPGGASLTLDVSYLIGKELMDQLLDEMVPAQTKWDKRFAKYVGTDDPSVLIRKRFDMPFMAKASKRVGSYPREPFYWHKGTPTRRKINRALIAALRELLRPVYIRDVPINILGQNPTIYSGDEAPYYSPESSNH